jgi:HAD domain in Swiss Army Knife RNA repair proteins
MKLIFLDIDGVLCTPAECMRRMVTVDGHALHHLNAEAVGAINHVTDSTGAVFVISSTWRTRGVPTLAKHFKNEGITGTILDRTPSLDSYERGWEILDWLHTHREIDVESFVILDDESDAAHTPELKERFIQSLWRDWENKGRQLGFTMEHADRAIKLLGVK